MYGLIRFLALSAVVYTTSAKPELPNLEKKMEPCTTSENNLPDGISGLNQDLKPFKDLAFLYLGSYGTFGSLKVLYCNIDISY